MKQRVLVEREIYVDELGQKGARDIVILLRGCWC